LAPVIEQGLLSHFRLTRKKKVQKDKSSFRPPGVAQWGCVRLWNRTFKFESRQVVRFFWKNINVVLCGM
jgi:hypothetical protein